MWKRQWLEPQEFIPVDEELVVVPMRIVSLGRYELETVAHAASVWTLRKGKITRVKALQSKDEPSKPWGCGRAILWPAIRTRDCIGTIRSPLRALATDSHVTVA